MGGAAADRLGRDQVVIGSLLLSVPFGVFLAFQTEFGPTFWLAAAGSGFFLNGSWISLTVRGQESVPGSIAMMSGLMLGLSIGLGGIAVTPFGIIAEHYGLPIVIAVTAALPLLGAILMRFVPHPRAEKVSATDRGGGLCARGRLTANDLLSHTLTILLPNRSSRDL